MRRSTRPRPASHGSLRRSATLMKSEGSIAHDARRIAGRVRRIAQVEELRGKAKSAGRHEQAVDGRRAARLTRIEGTAKGENLIRRRPVRSPCCVRREVVREIRADD